MKRRILILALHTDDEELGCSTSIGRFVEKGVKFIMFLFRQLKTLNQPNLPEHILKKEIKNAIYILGITHSNLIIHKLRVRKLNYFSQEISEELTLRNTV